MAFRIIISPAKRMGVVEGPPWATTMPRLLGRAEELVRAVRSLSYAQAKTLWKCSDTLAHLNYQRFAHMDLTRDVTAASLAYEGIQYRHLAPQVMDERGLAYLDERLRILSGLYGVLRPCDGVVPYRLEMQARLELPARGSRPATRNLYEFWESALAAELRKECDTVVNLASVEYAKAVTPWADDLGLRVLTCLFGSIRPTDGRFVQRSTEAKAARGTFVRWCAENGMHDLDGLHAFAERGYRLEGDRSSADTLVFVR